MNQVPEQAQTLKFNSFYEKETNKLFLIPTMTFEKDIDASLVAWHLTLTFLYYHHTLTLSKQQE